MKPDHNELVIKNSDYEKLCTLIDRGSNGTETLEKAAEALDEEVSKATIVPDDKLPPDVVAMHSTVAFKRTGENGITSVRLVYPEEADISQQKISVLSPVGSALIGLPTGGQIDWPMPNGKKIRIEIERVVQ